MFKLITPEIIETTTKFVRVKLADGTICKVSTLLGSGDKNTKLAKNETETYGLSMAPHTLAAVGNVCPHASPGCAAACLNGAGNGGIFPKIANARKAKTVAFMLAREWFLEKLHKELASKLARATGELAVRPNVFSDIAWERYGIIQAFPQIQFYDYTKSPGRLELPANYDLTYSRSELAKSETRAIELLASGARRVAVVFACKAWRTEAHKPILPRTWRGYPVFDGDQTDLRYLDPPNIVVGLRAKAIRNDTRDGMADDGFAVPCVDS